MNVLDLAILVWAGLAAVAGYRRGASMQLCEYAGLLVGLLAGALVAPTIAGLARTPLAQAGIAIAVLVAGGAGGEAAGWFVGRRIWSAAHRSALRPVDAVAGSIVSVMAVLLVTWFISYSLASGPWPTVSRQIDSSRIVHAIDDALPEPPTVLAEVRHLMGRFGFPQVFAGLPPAPAGPVTAAGSGEVRAIGRLVDASVARVVGGACGGIRSGSGFVAANHYVVTNAHVVAGMADPHVQFPNLDEPATTVLFDPREDLAVLYVRQTGPPLGLSTDVQPRGTTGAVIGFPGGGPQQTTSGAVRRSLEAVGRDIYGRSIVTRDVYELQATVLPGDSGGVFALSDGTVAGVVFAASTTDPGVGYALHASDVASRLAQAERRTTEVPTEGCAR